MKNINSNHRLYNRVKIIIGLLIFIVMACVFVYTVLNLPHYIVLPIQPPNPDNQRLHNSGWSSVEYTKETRRDSKDRFYNWRVKKGINIEEGGFDTWESIFSYIHDQLVSAGWVPYEISYGNPCHTVLPESGFLPKGVNGYMIYKRQSENEENRYFPITCLAIWPDYYADGRLWAYWIVLSTQNPSLRTYFNHLFD